MRVLKYAILGLLDQCELTGYDISNILRIPLDSFGVRNIVKFTLS